MYRIDGERKAKIGFSLAFLEQKKLIERVEKDRETAYQLTDDAQIQLDKLLEKYGKTGSLVMLILHATRAKDTETALGNEVLDWYLHILYPIAFNEAYDPKAELQKLEQKDREYHGGDYYDQEGGFNQQDYGQS